MSLAISPHFSSEDQQEFKERTLSGRLSVNELSRILEVPLSLLETEQQPNDANDHNEQQPRYWVPTCNNTDLISSQFEDGTVTHSFANRKRSVVKRRQSVLSHSFTAESEAEAIKMERESALAALENRLKKEQRESVGEIDKRKSLRRSTSLTLPTNTEFGYPDIQNSPILIFGRGPALRRGAKSKFQRRSSCDTPSEISNYLSNAVEIQELPPSPTESTASISTCTSSSPPHTFTMQVSDYSSDNDTASILPEEPLFKSLAPEAAEQQDQIFPVESIQKKSKLPWSKRIFSKSKKQKSSSVMILNNDDDDEKMDDTISIDQGRQNHSKFNLSSLFFRKQNINVLKKNKSAVNLSTPIKDASPFTSTETLMSTYYNKGANDTSKATAETKGPNNFNNNRLPIHKERAIYKLSHHKLTHPRRPLRDQVMISNLMFWYLSIINHSNNSSLFCENASLARKTYGIPIAGANRRGTRRKNNNQIRHHSKNPASIPQRVGSKTHPKSRHHQRTKYTSLGSDESDDSDDDGDSSSDEEDLDGAEKVHHRKYRNHANIQNHSTRLQHHQKPHHTATHIKNQDSSEEEDDVPLAMYKPKRS